MSTTQPPAAPNIAGSEAPKKRRRIFLWVFLAIQVLFILWIAVGIGGADSAADCGTLDAETCQAAADIGTGIGVIFIVGVWVVVDFLLGVGYAIYRLASRP